MNNKLKDGKDHSFIQHDGHEVARIHDGSPVRDIDTKYPDVTPDSYGFGSKMPVFKIDAAIDATTYLTKEQSGSITSVYAGDTSVVLYLPKASTSDDIGLTYTIVTAEALGGSETVAIKLQTAGKFYMHGIKTSDDNHYDVAGTTLTLPNSTTQGSVVRLTSIGVQMWLAEVYSPAAVTNA